MKTLLQFGRELAKVFQANGKGSQAYSAGFQETVVSEEFNTLALWDGDYAEAWKAFCADAGKPAHRKALKKASDDLANVSVFVMDDEAFAAHVKESNKAFSAWNKAHSAERVKGKMKVYRSTVTKVLARVRDKVGQDFGKVWEDVTAEEWTTLREHFGRFPNMDLALTWGEHGGSPDAPVDPGNGPQNGGKETPEAPKAPLAADDAEIVETIRLRYDDTAATAVENVLRAGAERKRIRERDAAPATK